MSVCLSSLEPLDRSSRNLLCRSLCCGSVLLWRLCDIGAESGVYECLVLFCDCQLIATTVWQSVWVTSLRGTQSQVGSNMRCVVGILVRLPRCLRTWPFRAPMSETQTATDTWSFNRRIHPVQPCALRTSKFLSTVIKMCNSLRHVWRFLDRTNCLSVGYSYACFWWHKQELQWYYHDDRKIY